MVCTATAEWGAQPGDAAGCLYADAFYAPGAMIAVGTRIR